LLEDALDRAEAHALSKPLRRRGWSLWVRMLRWMLARRHRCAADVIRGTRTGIGGRTSFRR
jgi:hypothetical protein